MKYFTRKRLERDFAGREDWMNQIRAYREEFKKHEPKLSQSALAFHKTMRLHDEVLSESTYRRRPHGAHELEVVVGPWRITFLCVSKHAGWAGAMDQAWLYDEVYSLAGGQFQLLVLLEGAECEVIAKDVRCYEEQTKRYIVEPDLPPPTREERKRTAKSMASKKRRNH
jgi:hypothetical protein